MRARGPGRSLPLWLCAALLASTLIAAGPALAFRCGGRIVSEGDHASKVRKVCGEPVSIQERVIYRSGITRPHRRAEGPGNGIFLDREVFSYDRSYVEIVVEEWTYNFGPRRLMQLVRFENGFVAEIKAIGYGFSD